VREHRRLKQFYARTNKAFRFQSQVSYHIRREHYLKLMREREIKKDLKRKTDGSTDHLPPPLKRARFSSPHDEDFDSDPLPPFSARNHYQISDSLRDFLNLPRFLTENSDNNALIVSNCSHYLMELNHQ